MATVIDRLIATLSLDGVAFQRGIENAKSQANDFGNTIGTQLKRQLAGAFTTTALIAFSRSTIEAASNIQDLAERLQLSTDAVQKLEGAGRMVGVPLQATEAAMTKLLDNLQSGAKGVPEALDAIGMSLEQIQAMSFDDAIVKIGDGLSSIEDSGKRAEAAMALFGSRGGLKALQVLQEMKNQSPIFSKNDLEVIDQIGDDISKAFRMAQKGGASILQSLVAHPAQVLGAMSVHGFDWEKISATLQDVRGGKPTSKSPIGGNADANAAFDAKLEKAKEWMAIQDEILKLEEETAKNFETSRVAQLTTEERRNELLEERLKLTEKLSQMDASGVDFARTMNRVSEIDTALVGLKPEEAVKARGFGGSVSSDSLTAIGGFTGGSSGAASVSDKLSTVTDILRRVENLMDGQGIKIRKF